MPERSRSRVYFEVLAAVALMTAVRWAIQPIVEYRLPFVTLFFAVFFAAWRGGFKPALLATGLSALASVLLFFEPRYTLRLTGTEPYLGFFFFIATGLAVGWLGENSLRARRGAEAAAREAEAHRLEAEEQAVRAEEEAAQAEELRLQSDLERERTSTILESISDAFLVLDHQWRIVFLNAQALRLAGAPAEALLGRDAREVFPEGISEFQEWFRRARSSRDVVRFAAFFPPLDRWFETTIYPVAEGYSVIAQDITARRIAELQLAESEERLRLGMDVGRFGVWDWDIARDRITWSPRVYEFHGVQPGAFGGTLADFQRLVHPDDIARVGETIRSAIERRAEYRVELRVVHPSGQVRWLSTTGRVLYDDEGRPVRMLGATHDITDTRQAEARLRQIQRVEAAGRLAGGVAHEVNNQMTVVLGLADMLLRAPGLGDQEREDVRQIRRAGERSARITAQLLAFSRRQLFQPEILDLNQVVSEFTRVIEKTAGEPVRVEIRLSPDVMPVFSDRGQLEQVLLNLALNAVDAMPEGGTLTVETSNVALSPEYAFRHQEVAVAPGLYVMLSVSDTGSGMAPEVLHHVFEPFFTTKSVGEGSGLGLSSAYGIVKQSNGYIWAYSEPGSGSVFKVYLPARTATAAVLPQEVAPSRSPARGRLLVVDDDAEVRSLIARVLQDEGYEVVEAEDGRSALGRFEAGGRFTLVLTDVAMPGMNGSRLGREVETRYPGTPVMYMSGYTDTDVVLRGLVDRGVPFIQKPFTPEALVVRVRAMLEKKS